MREPYKPRVPRKFVGGYRPKIEAQEKACGKVAYADDITRKSAFPGLLYAKVLRCPYAHARIRSLDTSPGSIHSQSFTFELDPAPFQVGEEWRLFGVTASAEIAVFERLKRRPGERPIRHVAIADAPLGYRLYFVARARVPPPLAVARIHGSTSARTWVLERDEVAPPCRPVKCHPTVTKPVAQQRQSSSPIMRASFSPSVAAPSFASAPVRSGATNASFAEE